MVEIENIDMGNHEVIDVGHGTYHSKELRSESPIRIRSSLHFTSKTSFVYLTKHSTS